MSVVQGVVPHLTLDRCADAIAFYEKAFGAREVHERVPGPDGVRLMHAEIMIGPSKLMLCDDFPEYCGGKSRHPRALGGVPMVLHQNVPDCDAAIARALAAGATVVMPPEDQFWGDRYGVVEDPFGYQWSFAHPLKK